MSKTAIEASSIGKRVGSARYLHKAALSYGQAGDQEFVDRAVKIAGVQQNAFNVLKFDGEPPTRISLLAYENFDSNPFPALLDSWTVDLVAGRRAHKTYRRSRNPPILHRKELLLAPDDPRRETFASLTKELERRNLFQNAKTIGFRNHWAKQLSKSGISIRNHLVFEEAAEAGNLGERSPSVERHRTAMSRSVLSAPMQALARHGFLDGNKTIFDYGCGRGDDIAVLSAAGIRANGWDPHFSPGSCLEESDIVNLGYVLNVIEEPLERVKALRAGYGLARDVIAVAVLIVGKVDTSSFNPYRDGFMTTRGTFQKYFTHEEARRMIERAIDQEAIPVGPGVFFAFRNKIAEQRFLEARHRRHQDISHLLAITPPPMVPTSRDETLLEENRELITAVWQRAIDLGRLPSLDELDGAIQQELAERIGSVRVAAQLAQRIYNSKTLSQARQARNEDLKVYFALNCFSRRTSYRELPRELQRDVKTFFGSYAKAEENGRQLLFSLGDPTVILTAAQEASLQGIGYLDGIHSIQLDGGLINRLPAPLRAYIGCAEQIYGDIGSSDIVKIHIQSSKLTILYFEQYKKTPLPRLRERIKINLREQSIDFFEYHDGKPAQLLYFKSRYMAKNQLGYRRQKAFDDKLASLKLVKSSQFGPSSEELFAYLGGSRLAIQGFDIVST